MSSDRPDSPESPDDQPAQPRRPRRARESGTYDFRTRFGTPGSTPPAPRSAGPSDPRRNVPAPGGPGQRAEGLREPAAREGYVRPRGRLTVRQLMEQMGVDDTATPESADRYAAPSQRAGSRPQPPRRRPTPPPVPPVQPPASAEVTQMIPAVTDDPAVDLSDTATAARLSEESRGQRQAPAPETRVTRSPAAMDEDAEPEAVDEPRKRRRPLEPTPDLTAAFEKIGGGRRSLTAKQRTRKAATNGGRILLGLACLLSLVGTGYVWNLKRGWNGGWNVVNALDPNSSNIRKPQDQNGDETYLIVGTDSRAGKNSKVGAGDASSVEGARSDTVLLVNIPADRSRVVAVSWPRDLAVDRPECQSWDNTTASYSGTLEAASGVKLNGVYADGGPNCLVKTLTQISGLNINHFIAMDFSGFEQVVRTLGGVTVCSTVPLYDYELGTILRKAGTKKLTAGQALKYVRARHISAEGNGDYGRIKRQQLFMSSLLRSSLSSDVLSNPSKLNKIVQTFIKNSYVDNVDTDSLIQLAESMQGMEAGRVTFLTVPTAGTTTDGENNEIPRMEDIDAIFNAIIDDKPLPGEKKSKPESTTKAPSPQAPVKKELTAQDTSNVSVRVLNGTDQSGLATNVMEELLRQGVNVGGVADSSEKQTSTVVRYGTGAKDSAATIAKMFPGAKIQADSSVKAGVEVILGADFAGIESIASAPAVGSTLTVSELPAHVGNSDLPNDLSVTNAGDTTCT
ncbi:MAG: LCP family protein [Gordonia sp. (in: high G+C Gram-positive bacteria)]|uniref:LCP family protein n=2 Tax=Gordonia sp. (in: high G+C Gram-positive bacteria) TaxID=84139 RepID=UPI003C742173